MTPQYRYYREAKDIIKEINEHKEKYVIIWYARGKINGVQRIIGIGVNPLSGQPHYYSIQSEINSIRNSFSGTKDEYDKCEKKMLQRFYDLVRGPYREKIWLHWRMVLYNYSFYTGLEDRYKSLAGRPTSISENNIIDVCDLFRKRYGETFVDKNKKVDGTSWRIKYLAELNSIETAGFLEFLDEEKALNDGQEDLILTSLSRKTRILKQFIDLSYKGTLKTDSNWKFIYGLSIQGLYEACRDQWWFNLVVFLLGLIIGILF